MCTFIRIAVYAILVTAWLFMACRCPNPSACKHDHEHLAMKHPEGQNGDRYSWANYSSLLCAVGEGYEGAVCGTCAIGYGMTSPFNCNACLGAKQPASKAYLSMVYIIYWVLLSVWLGLSVWSAMPSNDKEQDDEPHSEPLDLLKVGAASACSRHWRRAAPGGGATTSVTGASGTHTCS